MSKERELLKKWLIDFGKVHPSVELMKETQQLLAQPEPVGIVRTIGGYPDQSEHTVELICRHGDLRDGDLLYTAPPTREPLGKEIKVPCGTTEYMFGFKDGVLYAEKEHGIGE